jgi:hypothetical protein
MTRLATKTTTWSEKIESSGGSSDMVDDRRRRAISIPAT